MARHTGPRLNLPRRERSDSSRRKRGPDWFGERGAGAPQQQDGPGLLHAEEPPVVEKPLQRSCPERFGSVLGREGAATSARARPSCRAPEEALGSGACPGRHRRSVWWSWCKSPWWARSGRPRRRSSDRGSAEGVSPSCGGAGGAVVAAAPGRDFSTKCRGTPRSPCAGSGRPGRALRGFGAPIALPLPPSLLGGASNEKAARLEPDGFGYWVCSKRADPTSDAGLESTPAPMRSAHRTLRVCR